MGRDFVRPLRGLEPLLRKTKGQIHQRERSSEGGEVFLTGEFARHAILGIRGYSGDWSAVREQCRCPSTEDAFVVTRSCDDTQGRREGFS